MKTILAAVNSQYIHSNLAVWQLKANCPSQAGAVFVREYNINQQPKWVYRDLVEEAPDVIAFSCYIWNISFVLKLAEDIKAALPHCFLLLGGPEVSFDYQELLKSYPFLDAILVGEGEHTFAALLTCLNQGKSLNMEGLCTQENPAETTYVTEPDLNTLADPYTPEMLDAVKGKIVYFEGSRGCPFACAYCLSQISHGVRYLDIERVQSTLLRLETAGIELVKFVDRTFNCNSQRAVAIWRFAATSLHTLKLHFEIGADLLDQKQMDALSDLPPGWVQLEAGVQSANEKTLLSVCRKTDLTKLEERSGQLLAFHNVHYHLDLIAGLPYEDYASFSRSFDRVFALRPHQLQLGFLKMLKGTKIRQESVQYQYQFRSYPPYEVISNAFLSPADITKLIDVEEAVERYYNSGNFSLSLDWLLQKWESPFTFFEALAKNLAQVGALERNVSASKQFPMLLDFAAPRLNEEEVFVLRELLRCDYLLSGLRNALPEALINQQYRYTKPLAEAFFTENRFADYGISPPINKKEMMRQYLFACFGVNPFSPDKLHETAFFIDTFNKDPISGRYFSRIIL